MEIENATIFEKNLRDRRKLLLRASFTPTKRSTAGIENATGNVAMTD
jgi:hypothetical protein